MARTNPSAPVSAALTPVWHGDIQDHVNALVWSPDGHRLAAAAVGGPIPVYETAAGTLLHQLPGHGFGTSAIAWAASGKHFASAGQDGKARFWDLQSGQETQQLAGGAPWVERLAWCPGADLLVTAAGKKLRLWDATGRLLREYPDAKNTIADIQWKPIVPSPPTPLPRRSEVGTEPILASVAYGQLSLWSPDKTDPLSRFEWKGSMLVLAWSPDGKYIATGDQDSTVHFWIVESGEDLQMFGYPTKVRELSWDRTSRYLATGGGSVPCVWDCTGKGPAGTTPLQFEAHTEKLSALAFQKAGPILASAGEDGLLALWHPGRQQSAVALARLAAPITQISWSPDDRRIAVGTDQGTIAVFAVK